MFPYTPQMTNHSSPDNSHDESQGDLAVAQVKPKLRRPPLWQVIMLNDDFTPMDFVVNVLLHIFNLSLDDAVQRMMQVHHEGQAVVGVFPKEVAEMKMAETHAVAESEGHPLRVVIQRVPDSGEE